jgi:putative copper resistance protein D
MPGASSLVLLAALAAAGATYGAGVRRLHRHWPVGRSIAFAAGLVATDVGLQLPSDTSLTAHVVEHLLIGMLGPMLLARAGVITLALQTLSDRRRRGLRLVVRSRAARVLTDPVVGGVLFVTAMVSSLWPPLVQASLAHPPLHALSHLHLVTAGLVLWWPVVGVDRAWRATPGRGLLAVAATIPLHAFASIVLASARAPIAGDGFTLADQRRAAAILSIGGELLTVVAGGLLARRWLEADRREAARADRALANAA